MNHNTLLYKSYLKEIYSEKPNYGVYINVVWTLPIIISGNKKYMVILILNFNDSAAIVNQGVHSSSYDAQP